MIERKCNRFAPGRGQNCLADDFFRRFAFGQKWILRVGFVSQASAAGLLPLQLFIENDRIDTLRSQLGGGECARGPTPENRNLHGWWPLLTCGCPAGKGPPFPAPVMG